MSLGSFFNSIFTPPGYNAAKNQQTQKADLQNQIYGLTGSMLPLLQSQIGFANSLEPYAQQNTTQLLNYLNPANNKARVQDYTNSAMSAARQAGAQTGGQLAAQGYSPAVQAGAMSAASQQAAQSANQYAAQLASPQNILAQAEAQAGILGQAMGLQGLSGYGALANMVMGTPIMQPMQSPISSMLGSVAPFLPSLLGGGSSSSGGSSDGGFAGGLGGIIPSLGGIL